MMAGPSVLTQPVRVYRAPPSRRIARATRHCARAHDDTHFSRRAGATWRADTPSRRIEGSATAPSHRSTAPSATAPRIALSNLPPLPRLPARRGFRILAFDPDPSDANAVHVQHRHAIGWYTNAIPRPRKRPQPIEHETGNRYVLGRLGQVDPVVVLELVDGDGAFCFQHPARKHLDEVSRPGMLVAEL